MKYNKSQLVIPMGSPSLGHPQFCTEIHDFGFSIKKKYGFLFIKCNDVLHVITFVYWA